jgi:hypothetical protein
MATVAPKEAITVMVEPEKVTTSTTNAERGRECELQPMLEWDEVYIGLSLVL